MHYDPSCPSVPLGDGWLVDLLVSKRAGSFTSMLLSKYLFIQWKSTSLQRTQECIIYVWQKDGVREEVGYRDAHPHLKTTGLIIFHILCICYEPICSNEKKRLAEINVFTSNILPAILNIFNLSKSAYCSLLLMLIFLAELKSI